MYVIIVYDVNQKIVGKLCSYLKTKLNWIQNSVFEGNITKSQLLEIKNTLKELIDLKSDSILIFTVQNKAWITKNVIGIEKSPITNIF